MSSPPYTLYHWYIEYIIYRWYCQVKYDILITLIIGLYSEGALHGDFRQRTINRMSPKAWNY